MKKYKNIIFDMGGVLVNWKPKEFIKKIFQDKPHIQEINWQNLSQSKIFQDFEKGILNFDQVLNLVPEKKHKEQIKIFFENLHTYICPLKEGLDIFDLIKNKNYKTYILSNFEKDLFEKSSNFHNYNNFLDKFDGQIISYRVNCRKPEPKIYQILLKNYNLKPEESFFIDDMPENINSAKNLGIDGVICKNHEIVLNTFKELHIL
ncbi:MAG: HAD family phosphatase [Candidatus Babeliales bacterium]